MSMPGQSNSYSPTLRGNRVSRTAVVELAFQPQPTLALLVFVHPIWYCSIFFTRQSVFGFILV